MSEIIDALNQLEREKNISKEVIMEAIEKSLITACEKDFGKDASYVATMDRETGDITLYQEKLVVEDDKEDINDACEISLTKALAMNKKNKLGDTIKIEIKSKEFGRIAAQKARSIIVQTIKESERDAIFDHFACKEKDIIVGIVQKNIDRNYNDGREVLDSKNISIRLDEKTDTILTEAEQVPGEVYVPGDRIKVYVVEVRKTNKGFRILVSRTHPDLVKRLFEKEVTEVADGTVEIKSISREAGSRTKIAVWSNDENVDPVGACVGVNGTRVNNIVEDLKGEKIDIINWSEDTATFIKNSLSPSRVLSVMVEEGTKNALVVVPDDQLSLAIGIRGQNARLAAKLTGCRIDIKSESQARELGIEYDNNISYDEYDDDDYDEDYDDSYDESYEDEE